MVVFMKKINTKRFLKLSSVALILISLAFILAGCKTTKAEFTLQPFTSAVSLKTDGILFEGQFEYTSPTQMSLTITKPEIIAGIKLENQNGKIDFNYSDLKYTSAAFENLTKDENIFKNLFEALKSFGNETFEIDVQGKTNHKGSYEYGEYSAVIDGASEKLSTIETNGTLYSFSYKTDV